MSNISSENWMSESFSIIGDKSLRQICIPGSHDSGMSEKESGTMFATANNTVTQTKDIGGQLLCGIRFFDIRPVIGSRKQERLRTGHYSYINIPGVGWQGANGQSISSIVNQINFFLKDRRELVILNLSHSLNTDVGRRNYRRFDQRDWEDALNEFMKIELLYSSAKNNPDVDLMDLTLKNFIGEKSSVILYIDDTESVNLDNYNANAIKIFRGKNFNIYDSYANSNSVDTVARDQLEKMRRVTGVQPFYLSWTMTQQGIQQIIGESIISMADKINGEFGRFMMHISPCNFPNIISVDNVTDGRVADAAIEINNRLAAMGEMDKNL